MGHVSFSMPREIVIKFKQNGKIVNFVETGTFQGGTSFWAASHFTNVYTIEIDAAISKATAAKSGCPKNINFFIGNSKDILPQIVPQLVGRTFFWLDGHWCNTSELGKDEECPVLDEIKAIKSLSDAIILIDDARAFLGPLPPPNDGAQWPRIDEIIIKLKSYFPSHFCTIVDDVIFCIPPDLIKVFDEYWISSFYKRFGNTSLMNKTVGKVKSFFKNKR